MTTLAIGSLVLTVAATFSAQIQTISANVNSTPAVEQSEYVSGTYTNGRSYTGGTGRREILS